MKRGPFQPGDSCNQYKIVRSIGVGGFGHVYEAVREFKVLNAGILQPFGQNVALKCLVVDQANDPERIQRLNLEAVLLLQLKHPNIVGFVDWGMTEDGTAYFAMDLLHGKNLSQTMKERRFSPVRSIYVAAEIADGMAYAHGKGVTHRDLKPGNVFVTDQWDVKVLDLGAAKYKHSPKRVTHSGQLPPCTITYAAPEQLRDSGDVDGRADVFALGIITYQMLTGHHPFSENARTVDEQISRQLECAAPPLVDRGVPDYLARAVHEALAKKAEDRPSMEQFRDGLRSAYSRYVAAGGYEDKGLAAIVERRTLRARVQSGRSEPTGVPAVKADAVTKPNLLPPIDSRAPTKPARDGLPPTDIVDVHASSSRRSPSATSSGPDRSASTNTAVSEAPIRVAAMAAGSRRDGWSRLGKFYERIPRAVKVSAAGLFLLPLGLVVAESARRADVHADPRPVSVVAQLAPEAPSPAVAVEPAKREEQAPEAPKVVAPLPAPSSKPRRSALQGIHTPKWDTLSSPVDKSSLVLPE